MNYQKRIIDSTIEKYLEFMGAIVLEGARYCGKTMTGLHHAKSDIRIDSSADLPDLLTLNPNLALSGETPRLIDEWQLAPTLWNLARHEVDARQKPGQFILTGSSFPADDITRHSGAGRFARLKMRTMSLLESGHSSGEVSLKSIFEGQEKIIAGSSSLDFETLIERLCVGGWPAQQKRSVDQACVANKMYLNEHFRTDIENLDGVSISNPQNLERVITSLARNNTTSASFETISKDTDTEKDIALDSRTVKKYLQVLERLMIYEPLPSWYAHLRSKERLQTKPKIHFVDPSLAVAALDTNPLELQNDLETLGLLFESLVIRDLRIYAQNFDAQIYHYHDNKDLEADAIIATPNAWAAVEVKLNPKRVDEAIASLNKVVAKVDEKKTGKPRALIVITGGQYAYTKDGVHVIPISCLGI